MTRRHENSRKASDQEVEAIEFTICFVAFLVLSILTLCLIFNTEIASVVYRIIKDTLKFTCLRLYAGVLDILDLGDQTMCCLFLVSMGWIGLFRMVRSFRARWETRGREILPVFERKDVVERMESGNRVGTGTSCCPCVQKFQIEGRIEPSGDSETSSEGDARVFTPSSTMSNGSFEPEAEHQSNTKAKAAALLPPPPRRAIREVNGLEERQKRLLRSRVSTMRDILDIMDETLEHIDEC